MDRVSGTLTYGIMCIPLLWCGVAWRYSCIDLCIDRWIMARSDEQLAADELEYAAMADDFRNYWDGDDTYEQDASQEEEESTENMWEF
jgi:hypothetical protein